MALNVTLIVLALVVGVAFKWSVAVYIALFLNGLTFKVCGRLSVYSVCRITNSLPLGRLCICMLDFIQPSLLF